MNPAELPNEALEKFGERLRDVRVQLNLTQEELARLLDIKRQTLSSWEQGSTSPDVKTLLLLKHRARERARAVDLGALLGDARWDWGETPLQYPIRLLQAMDSHGIRGVYSNRGQALEAFTSLIKQELTSIYVVCSSFMGVIRVAPAEVSEALQRKAASIDVRILMTDPGQVSRLREDQEGRKQGSISKEIWDSVDELTKWGVKRESIRFYSGAPTVFLLFTPERMLVNPYTYGTEAFKTVTFEVARTRQGDIYSQYEENHFRRPWKSVTSKSIDEVLRESA
jgi:DNA-binding XRE family transcriptional regulator